MFLDLEELPDGWVWSSIEQIADYVQRGKQPKYIEFSDLPVINQKSVRWHSVEIKHLKYVHPSQWEKWAEERFVQEGDILWNSTGTGTVGRAGIYTKLKGIRRIVADSHVTIVRSKQCNSRYLHYWIMSPMVQSKIESMHTGSTNQVELSRTEVLNTTFPLPPLNEQRRIVTKIEELTIHSRRAREALDDVPTLINQFRQSVLAAAFRGDLTADWREKNPAKTWKQTTLGEIIYSKPRNGYSPKPVEFPTPVKSLTLSATTSGVFKREHFKYINEEIGRDSHLWLTPGDILIQRGNTIDYVGTSAIYTGRPFEFIYPDLMMKIQVVKEKALLEFIQYQLSSEATRKYFKSNATGTAGNMPKINQKVVMDTPILLPFLEEQKEIVKRINMGFAVMPLLSDTYEISKEDLSTLDKSILAKAFRGDLVPQDPNDEPASALLDRIRTEREKLVITKKKGRTSRKKTKPDSSE